MRTIRPCVSDEFDSILTIVNSAAQRYRGVIPHDRWHDPYMPADVLRSEIASGVHFWGMDEDGLLTGVMGIQNVRDVVLIRHAYVLPSNQGKGTGGELLGYLRRLADRPMLIGTWADASWAIRFYERHGFAQVAREHVPTLLRAYWDIPQRQVETSVVLAEAPVETLAAFS